MSIRRADPRFCLPARVSTAIVLGDLPEWIQGLADARVDVVRTGPADLAVAPRALVREALATGSNAVILEGRGGRRGLEHAGLRAEAVLARPRIDRAEMLLPLSERKPLAYAVANWAAGHTRARRLRNRLAAGLATRGWLPEVAPVVTLGVANDLARLPYLAQAATALGVPADAGWFMTCGHGDVLSRNVFQLFPASASRPEWVLKFARVPDYDDPFRRDERGLSLAANAGEAVAAHAPRLLGRFAVDGIQASLERAAPGRRLRAALVAPGAEREKLRLVERIGEWILAAARATAVAPEALRPELARLESDVLPAWSKHGVSPDLVRELPALPAVLQHNDVACWNIVVDNGDFTVVDWESAREHGLPLWDLVYFLTDALVTLDRPTTPAEEDELTRRLLAGESKRSPVLFEWLARGARELEIPKSAVGPIVTLGWLHHALSRDARAATIDRVGAGAPVDPAPVGRLAPMWLADPALGPGWKAWHGA
jgi:hypothetical protein